ncbi:hypothetical protein ScPMuIL_006267 [Solemya velum]
MTIKRKDFQKAAAFIHEFLLKLNEESECAELRDSLNLALLHMQKYYRLLQSRSHEKNAQTTLSLTARGLSPMTPFVDAPDKFQWRWINLDSQRLTTTMSVGESIALTTLPPIIQATKRGNADQVVELIQRDPSCTDEQDGIGRTALSYAVHFHQMEALHCLLENQADINNTAHDGSTALHQACHDANHIALSLLLQYGADYTVYDTQGRSPIHWAVTTTSMECLKLLISHDADVNVRDKDGLSPSMWACRLDHIQHFELLSRSENYRVDDADGIERDSNGRTWMHWAVRRTEPLECLQTLLTAETAAIRDDEGRTVLLTAAEMGSLPACTIIVEIGGTYCVNETDNNGRTALHLSAMGGHGEVVNFLLENDGDMYIKDKFNATAWDYASNRQLHYCQLILMSHQRQRIHKDPTSPMPYGMGLSFSTASSLVNGEVYGDDQDNFRVCSARGSVDSGPLASPHPPKRPRTGRYQMSRRSQSLTSIDTNNELINEQSNLTASDVHPRKERIEVKVNTRVPNQFPRQEIAMSTEEPQDEDVEEVSVGGMDVSDIEDDRDDEPMPTTARIPVRRGAQVMQPQPPPRFQPRPPQQSSYAQPLQPHYRRKSEDYDTEPESPTRSQFPITSQRIPATSVIQQKLSPSDSFPPPNRPRPAPRPPQNRQPPRPPPNRPTPSPVRPPSARDQVFSPPLSNPSSEHSSAKASPPGHDQRPGSGSTGPGVVEGRGLRIPFPMLTPLENAPKPPAAGTFEKLEKRKKKKKRERKEDKERDREKDGDPRVSPQDITPPRGYAAPLHPPPSATSRPQRAQQGMPSPKYSKSQPQRHELRYTEDDDEVETAKPPMVNGFAVPVKDGPIRSTNPGHRLQPMESEEYADSYNPASDGYDMANGEDDASDVGPLIPPPRGFGGTSPHPLSQSVPQDSHSFRMGPANGKPPLPRTRHTPPVSGRSARKNSPKPRRSPYASQERREDFL